LRSHADVTLESAVDLQSRARTALARLFGLMSARLTAEDVQRLAGLAGDRRTLSYFSGRLEGPCWLLVLVDHPLLQRPDEGPWYAYSYLAKVAKSHSQPGPRLA
jgi:hypothetical protein